MYDVVVIGSGPGGYVCAIKAAQLGLKVACVEKEKLGGTCLNVGCIPSKSLLHSSHMLHSMQHDAKNHGIDASGVKLNFKQMMKLKEETVTGFNQGIGGLFKKNKVEFLKGTATLTSPTSLTVDGEAVEAKKIVLATGSAPIELPFLPFDETQVVSSTGALALKSPPKKLAVIGGGVIGVELASVYARLGSKVTVIEMLDHICPGIESSVQKGLQQALEKQGIEFLLSTQVTEAKKGKKEVTLSLKGSGDSIKADVVLVCVGRKPYSEGLGLETVGVEADARGMVSVDGLFRTSVKSIYAIGDLIDGPMLAHKASEEGVAVAEIIAGHSPTVDYMSIPGVVYTHPEAASVGFTEEQAKEAGLTIEKGQFTFKANSRARAIGDDTGFVKVIGDKATGRLIGMHILHGSASELIAEGMLAIKTGATLKDLAEAPNAHPTLSESIKEAALAATSKPIHM